MLQSVNSVQNYIYLHLSFNSINLPFVSATLPPQLAVAPKIQCAVPTRTFQAANLNLTNQALCMGRVVSNALTVTSLWSRHQISIDYQRNSSSRFSKRWSNTNRIRHRLRPKLCSPVFTQHLVYVELPWTILPFGAISFR